MCTRQKSSISAQCFGDPARGRAQTYRRGRPELEPKVSLLVIGGLRQRLEDEEFRPGRRRNELADQILDVVAPDCDGAAQSLSDDLKDAMHLDKGVFSRRFESKSVHAGANRSRQANVLPPAEQSLFAQSAAN